MGLFSKEESSVDYGYYLINSSTNRIYKKSLHFVKQPERGIYRVDRRIEEALETSRKMDVNSMPVENLAGQEQDESFYLKITPAVEKLINEPGFNQAITGLLDPNKIRERLLKTNPYIRRQYLYHRIGKKNLTIPKVVLYVGTIKYNGSVYGEYTHKDEVYHTKKAKKDIEKIDEYIYSAPRRTEWQEKCKEMGRVITQEERRTKLSDYLVEVKPLDKEEIQNTRGKYVPRHAKKEDNIR